MQFVSVRKHYINNFRDRTLYSLPSQLLLIASLAGYLAAYGISNEKYALTIQITAKEIDVNDIFADGCCFHHCIFNFVNEIKLQVHWCW